MLDPVLNPKWGVGKRDVIRGKLTQLKYESWVKLLSMWYFLIFDDCIVVVL